MDFDNDGVPIINLRFHYTSEVDSFVLGVKNYSSETLKFKINNNIEYKCGKVKAELEENIDGSKAIKKIIE